MNPPSFCVDSGGGPTAAVVGGAAADVDAREAGARPT